MGLYSGSSVSSPGKNVRVRVSDNREEESRDRGRNTHIKQQGRGIKAQRSHEGDPTAGERNQDTKITISVSNSREGKGGGGQLPVRRSGRAPGGPPGARPGRGAAHGSGDISSLLPGLRSSSSCSPSPCQKTCSACSATSPDTAGSKNQGMGRWLFAPTFSPPPSPSINSHPQQRPTPPAPPPPGHCLHQPPPRVGVCVAGPAGASGARGRRAPLPPEPKGPLKSVMPARGCIQNQVIQVPE
jgi:hypothetical protein